MSIERNRRWRIEQKKKHKQKVKKYWLPQAMEEEPEDFDTIIGIIAKSKKNCNCWMCKNPRKTNKGCINELTFQERKELEKSQDQLNEI